MNWECSSLFEIVTSFILDEYLAVGYACSRFNFGGESPYCCPSWLHRFAFPVERELFLGTGQIRVLKLKDWGLCDMTDLGLGPGALDV